MALYDVLEVELESPFRVRVLERDKSEANADAITRMAVMRRGVVNHFYPMVPAGIYADGDLWTKPSKVQAA